MTNRHIFKTDDGFGGHYECVIVVSKVGKTFKLRSVQKLSSAYMSDKEFAAQPALINLGYYESKMLSESGFSDQDINKMHNLRYFSEV
ncbi:hypothetical protein [Alteromonas sp. 14N.309.X.WAT.G.H12]|uniref:hypothetical protein n=1 Tax=Alteromonas sp. 14N.309.X.WAT.G.H12 TaxID=3120824 RepID=UPI002FCEE362